MSSGQLSDGSYSQDNRPLLMDAEIIGCKPRHVKKDFDCADRINYQLSNVGAQSQQRFRMGTQFAGGWFEFGSPAVFTKPSTILGSGYIGDLWGYNEYLAYDGVLSRLVYTGGYAQDVAALDIATGSSARLDNFFLMGAKGTTLQAIRSNTAAWGDIGVLCRGEASGFNFGIVQVGGFRTGVQYGERLLPLINHADHSNGRALFLNHCMTGLRTNTVQSVNSNIGYVHAYGCTVGADFSLGGKWNIDHLYYAKGALPMEAALRVGQAVNYDPNSDKIRVGLLSIDQSVAQVAAGLQPRAVNIAGSGYGTVRIDLLDIPDSSAYAPTLGAFRTQSGWRLQMYGGGYLRERMFYVDVDAATPDAISEIELYGMTMSDGVDPTKLIHASSPGNCEIVLRNLRYPGGDRSFGGWGGYNADQYWVAGTISATRTLSFS